MLRDHSMQQRHSPHLARLLLLDEASNLGVNVDQVAIKRRLLQACVAAQSLGMSSGQGCASAIADGGDAACPQGSIDCTTMRMHAPLGLASTVAVARSMVREATRADVEAPDIWRPMPQARPCMLLFMKLCMVATHAEQALGWQAAVVWLVTEGGKRAATMLCFGKEQGT